MTILIIAALAAAAYVVRVRQAMVDFQVNYLAGQRLAAGETLYQTADGHYMFKYLPSSALLYVPLARLPLEAAKAIWFGLIVAGMVGVFWLAGTLVQDRRIPPRYLIIFPALILAKFFLHELRLGQINILVTLVMLVALNTVASCASSPRNQVVAGTLIGIATAMKPYAAIMFPYLVVKRWGWSLAAAVGVLLLALAVPAVFYGTQGNWRVLEQWFVTLTASTPELLTNNDNVSLIAFFTKWTGDRGLALTVTLAALVVLALSLLAVIFQGGRVGRPAVLEYAMLLVLIPLVSPLGWDYTFLMAILAVTLLVNYFYEFSLAARTVLAANFAVIALALYDTLGRQAYAVFMQWSVTTVNFVVVLGYLAYLRARRIC
jgi:hypothetical protein